LIDACQTALQAGSYQQVTYKKPEITQAGVDGQ
jgi:hypothetical protein